MTTDKIIQSLDAVRPYGAEAALMECNLPLKYLGSGAYRHVYHIVGTSLIIKFPCLNSNGQPSTVNIGHARDEYAAVSRVSSSKAKKYLEIKKHMPELYYHNCCTGLILGQKYKMLPTRANAIRTELSNKVCKALRLCDGDITNSGNVGMDTRGTLKILDAGYLLKQW